MAEWGSELYFSPGSYNSRGVMVLFNNSFNYKVEKVKTDPIGNYIRLDTDIQSR